MLLFSVVTILILQVQYTASLDSEVFYQTVETPCVGVAKETEHVDLYCSINVPSSLCSVEEAQLQWYYASADLRLMITDDDKYGVWSGDEKYGEISSVLRIRNLRTDTDVGLYTCSLSCPGSDIISSERVELCVENKATGLVLCNGVSNEESCSSVFANGRCEEHCDSAERLFDGGDCDSYLLQACPAQVIPACAFMHKDGKCDQRCNNAQCGYDGGDCLNMSLPDSERSPTLAVVTAQPSVSDEVINHLSLLISMRLSTLVRQVHRTVKWSVTNSHGLQVLYLNPKEFEGDVELTMIQFTLVPQSCDDEQRCFSHVRHAIKYLSNHLYRDTLFINTSIAALGVSVEDDDCALPKDSVKPGPPSTNTRRVYPQIVNRESTTPENPGTLGIGEIIGISLCCVSLLLLIVGLILAYRYHRIAKERKSQKNKQPYFNDVSTFSNGEKPPLSPNRQADEQVSAYAMTNIHDHQLQEV